MKVSVIIPFKNEKEYAGITVKTVHDFLSKKGIDFEIVVVDDSDDGTWEIIKGFERSHDHMLCVKGQKPAGYGRAIRLGFEKSSGDVLVPFNGDMCDSLSDLLAYVQVIEQGYDMVFGSRYMHGGMVINYPPNKVIFSKLGNIFLMVLFRARCSDLTNTFKAYRRHVIESIRPVSNSYEVGLETALKGVKNGFRYKTIPISWTGREYGTSKMNLKVSVLKHFKMSLKIFFGIS